MGPNQLNGKFLINGLLFNMDVINFSIPLNNTEIWSITNQSAIAHPFHIHDVQFYVLDRNGALPAPGEQGRKDVILIKPMETVRFITQFTDFANDSVPYMFHCHMLVHEDDGMMLQFEVVDKTTGIEPKNDRNYKIRIYPNPVFRKNLLITIAGNENGWLNCELFDLQGRLLFQDKKMAGKYSVQIQLPKINPGTYLLKLRGEKNTHQEKIIVN